MTKVIKVEVRGDLRSAIRQAVDGLGGFGRFISRGDRVLIKPNFNTSDRYPGSSDPEFIAAFADLCHEHGASEVTVADSSTYMADTRTVMKEIGVDRLAAGRPWIKLWSFDDGEWEAKEVPLGKYLKKVSVPKSLNDYDRMFFLACCKTHFIAKFTGALKLAVGLMRPEERLRLHLRRTQEKIAELCSVVKPDLVVMDARKCFINKGPAVGEVREPGLVLASTDRVAMDIEAIKVIQGFDGNSLAGVRPEALSQIERALAIGIDQV